MKNRPNSKNKSTQTKMGCITSKDVAAVKRPVQGVGQTERLIGKRERSNRRAEDWLVSSKQNSSGRQSSVRESKETRKLPMLDEDGHLMPEEVVKRSSSSIVSKSLELGTPDYPVFVEVIMLLLLLWPINARTID